MKHEDFVDNVKLYNMTAHGHFLVGARNCLWKGGAIGPMHNTKVSMIGNDSKLDTGIGNCGKAGQWVPVGVGQPHLRMDQITVGGTKA